MWIMLEQLIINSCTHSPSPVTCSCGYYSAENAKVFHQEISSDELAFAFFSMVSGCGVQVKAKAHASSNECNGVISQGLSFAACVNLLISFIAACKLQKVRFANLSIDPRMTHVLYCLCQAYKFHYIPKGLLFASISLVASSLLWATHYYVRKHARHRLRCCGWTLFALEPDRFYASA